MTKELIFKIVFYAILAYFLYKLLKKVSEKLGVTKSEEEEDIEAAAGTDSSTKSTSPFDYSQFFRKHKPTIKDIQKDGTPYISYSKQLYDSKGFWNDDEDSVYSVFRDTKTQLGIALIAKAFQLKYKKDLILYLDGFMSDNDLVKVVNMVKKKPIKR